MEVQKDEDKKQPEEVWLSPNAARIDLPLYDSDIIAKNYKHLDTPTVSREKAREHFGIDKRLLIHEEPMSKSGNETKISSEPKKKSFEEQVEDTRKRLEEDSKYWLKQQEFVRKMMPENDWRDIPGFSQYEMNRLGSIRGKKSKLERPTHVKLWRGGEDEVLIGVDALRAMTFGVKDG